MVTLTQSAPRPPTTDLTHPLVFFDGVCGLCNGVVDLLLKADKRGQLQFAPLQGETARQMLPPLYGEPEAWSLVYLNERGIQDQSDAALEIARQLGGLWWWLSLGRVVPRFIRHRVYRFIARHRYEWFGRHADCRLPSPEEHTRFLP